MPLTIRLLKAPDAPAYRQLRLRALTEDPAAFLTDAETYAASALTEVADRLQASDHSFTLGAFVESEFVESELVGMATLVRSTRPKQAHRADVLAVYVAPQQRGQGAAWALMTDLIERASRLPGLEVLELGVSETQSRAQNLYRKLGFEVWGVQPDAMRLGTRAIAEFHLQRRVSRRV